MAPAASHGASASAGAPPPRDAVLPQAEARRQCGLRPRLAGSAASGRGSQAVTRRPQAEARRLALVQQ
eukprot:1619801-Rhodomonas_salina.1